jgi:hypothetical protein
MVEPLTKMPEKPAQENPLKKYYRQPAIYIKLPTRGRHYDKETFVPTENEEIAVFPMTAKDEMAFKTPDALMNGQAMVDVMESCVPNIKNAWKLVNHDLDIVLLAIRIATYGETMDMTGMIPGTTQEVSHTVNLPQLLDSVINVKVTDKFMTPSGFEVTVKPMTYKEITDTQLRAFENQKQYANLAQRTDIEDSEKGKVFAENFKKLTDMNFDVMRRSIVEIKTPEGVTVEDQSQILDFVNNADRKLINEIQKGLLENRNQASLKPVKLKATDEQIKKGASATYEMPLTFDTANFFE